ncbi:MAG: hypothetical protein M3Q65_21025 [Chloroflexota bacterium]|nr:hypothetical protein [Chloroflexota bacterium]
MTVNALMTALIDELAAGDVPDVLAQPLTLAAVWDDLARLNGEDVPRWVAVALGDAGRALRPLPVPTADGRYEEMC